MTALLPPQVIEAPQPRALRYGLLAAANGPLDPPAPHGLAGGVTYKPDGCGVAHLYNTTTCPPDNPAKTYDPEIGNLTRPSFIAYASLICGAAGRTPTQLEDRVRGRLADGEQTVAEQGFATILAAGATPLVAPVPTSFLSVIGELEQWLYGATPAGAGYGYQGYLHVPYRYAAEAAFNQLVVKDGPLLRTPDGTIWVFGGGYPDDGTCYITGQVTVWRSADIFISPAASVLNRTTNQYRLLAEREYAASYDCVAASATFDWIPTS